LEKLPCGECPQSQQVDLEEVVLHVHVWHASGLVEDLQKALLLVQVVALLFHLVSCANSTIVQVVGRSLELEDVGVVNFSTPPATG
jgi:hypothetical protein